MPKNHEFLEGGFSCLTRAELPELDISSEKVIPADKVSKLLSGAMRIIKRCPKMKKENKARDAMLVVTGLLSGLRVSELIALRWGDVAMNHNPPRLIVQKGKGGKYREVLVPYWLLDFLSAYRRWAWGAGWACVDGEYIFCSPRSGKKPSPIKKRTAQFAIARMYKRYDLAGFSAHSLRHTFATGLYRASGKDLQLVQWQLGHDEARTTCIYIGLLGEDVVESLQKLHKGRK